MDLSSDKKSSEAVCEEHLPRSVCAETMRIDNFFDETEGGAMFTFTADRKE